MHTHTRALASKHTYTLRCTQALARPHAAMPDCVARARGACGAVLSRRYGRKRGRRAPCPGVSARFRTAFVGVHKGQTDKEWVRELLAPCWHELPPPRRRDDDDVDDSRVDSAAFRAKPASVEDPGGNEIDQPAVGAAAKKPACADGAASPTAQQESPGGGGAREARREAQRRLDAEEDAAARQGAATATVKKKPATKRQPNKRPAAAGDGDGDGRSDRDGDNAPTTPQPARERETPAKGASQAGGRPPGSLPGSPPGSDSGIDAPDMLERQAAAADKHAMRVNQHAMSEARARQR